MRKEGQMALMRTDPLNRLFGDDDLLESRGIRPGGDWTPAVDILETDLEITIRAELPGVEAKDVTVSLDNNVLTLKGERRTEKEMSKEHYHRMERAFGSFSRSFAIPAFVDVDNVRAEFRN